MGTQSTTHPPRASHAPLRIAPLLLLFLASTRNAPAQTSVSALTVPLILPSAIVFDPTGNLYFAETGSHVVRKIDTTGNITTIAGTGTQGFSGDAGPATSATLDPPHPHHHRHPAIPRRHSLRHLRRHRPPHRPRPRRLQQPLPRRYPQPPHPQNHRHHRHHHHHRRQRRSRLLRRHHRRDHRQP